VRGVEALALGPHADLGHRLYGQLTPVALGNALRDNDVLYRSDLTADQLHEWLVGSGVGLVALPDAPLPDPDTPAPVRFLHTWEAALLVHARRTLVLPEAHRKLVFDVRMPFSTPTFLVDGAVAGSWRYEDGAVRLSPFEPLSPRARRELMP